MMPGAESQAAEFTHLVVTMMVLMLMMIYHEIVWQAEDD